MAIPKKHDTEPTFAAARMRHQTDLDVPSPSSISRRQLLAGLASAPLSLALTRASQLGPAVSIGLATSVVPSIARAEPVTATLAVASAVAGLIAAHNRSDGGMGAILSANLEFQRVLTEQLMSVQEGMAALLLKVNELPTEFQKLLNHERLKDLHAKIGAQVRRYQYYAGPHASTFSTFQEWTADKETREMLRDIAKELDNVPADAMQQRWLDPVTAFYLPAAAYASLGVRAALGVAPRQLKAEAQRYLDLFVLIEDATETGSTAAELASRLAAAQQLREELLQQGYKVPIEDIEAAAPTDIRLGKVAIQDYRPRVLVKEDYRCIPRDPDTQREYCYDNSVYLPERKGPLEAFALTAKVEPFPLESARPGGPRISIRQFRIDPKLALKDMEFKAEVDRPLKQRRPMLRILGTPIELETVAIFMEPGPTLPPVVTVDAMTTEDRKKAAVESEAYATAERKRALLELLLARLNEEHTRLALCGGALAIASTTRRGLFKYFGQEA